MMQIWLDTIDIDTIEDAFKTGIISGVTTNPSILCKAKSVRDTLWQLLDMQPGPVAVQVTADSSSEIVEEARCIFEFSSRMIIKIPINHEGLIAINELKMEGIPILGTGILYPSQALLAAIHEVEYIAPYFSHMGENAHETLKAMVDMLKGSKTKILAASIKKLDDIISCALLGVEAITIKPELYRQLVAGQPAVEHFTDKFLCDWKQGQGEISIKDALQTAGSKHRRKDLSFDTLSRR